MSAPHKDQMGQLLLPQRSRIMAYAGQRGIAQIESEAALLLGPFQQADEQIVHGAVRRIPPVAHKVD
ncbi:hypothetical protein D3C79_1075660 [compost metagenome]